VRQESLIEVAERLELGKLVRAGAAQVRPSVLANALEALFGAILLDGGYVVARRAVVSAFGSLLEELDPGKVEKDAKTRLQELMHARGKQLPEYRVVATRGTPHQPSFEVECFIPGLNMSATATGTSLQRAQQQAAKMLLERLEP
jgi:ribonuclease-3